MLPYLHGTATGAYALDVSKADCRTQGGLKALAKKMFTNNDQVGAQTSKLPCRFAYIIVQDRFTYHPTYLVICFPPSHMLAWPVLHG